MLDHRMLIGGELVDGGRTLEVINPATGAAFATCACAVKEDIDSAVDAAAGAFAAWSATPIRERAQYLNRLADALDKDAEEFARLLTSEQGKPLAEARAEVAYTSVFIRHFAGSDIPERVIDGGAGSRIEMIRKPLGVVAAIVPWNFPLLTISFKLPPALLAGNTIVVKAAATTPLTALRLGSLCRDIFPAGAVNIVTDANDLGDYLSSQPRVAKISFTGSTATGRKVMASAAGTIKRLTLELGGNDAGIVLDDADPAAVARGVFEGAFLNCGQVCIALKRLYVPDVLHDAIRDELVQLADGALVGDGMDEGTRFGPLQNEVQFKKVRGLIEEARAEGATVHGGAVLNRPGYFIRPAIVTGLSDGSRLVDEEQFGPVLPLVRYSETDDAIGRANASEYGLGASVWSSDLERARSVAARMDAGTVWINKHLDFGPGIPFAGAKQSGLGVEFAEEGLAEFTQIKIINAAV